MKTTTGLTITEKKVLGATRIEVDSEKYNEEPIYQDVTLDTECSNFRKAQFIELLKAI